VAVAFRSSATKKYGATVNCTVNKPTGTVDGDLLVAIFSQGNNTPVAVTAPAGWALNNTFTDIVDIAGFKVRNSVYTKTASSEGASWTWTHASSSTECTVLAITGADLGNPISPAPPAGMNVTTAGTQTTTALGVTTPRDSSLVIFFGQDWADTVNTLVAPTGSTPTFTERATGATTALQSIATGVLATAGATGNKTQTNNNNSGGNSTGGGVLIVIQPDVPFSPGASVGPGIVVGSPTSFIGRAYRWGCDRRSHNHRRHADRHRVAGARRRGGRGVRVGRHHDGCRLARGWGSDGRRV
jgi:hypothetical protein